jgi:hypothetical protein
VRWSAYLAQAERRVVESELRVTKQMMFIETLAAAGFDTTWAEKLLEVMMQWLTLMYERLHIVRAYTPTGSLLLPIRAS